MIRVAMIGLRGIPSRDGGVEVAVEELAPRLKKLGVKVTVYCRTPYVSELLQTYKGVELVNLPTINNKHFEAFVHTLFSTFHALFINKIDIVHYHALGNALFTRLPSLFGKKCIVTIHGFDYQREKWSPFAKWVLKLGEKQAVNHANSVISVSKKIKQVLTDRYNRVPVWIPNGIPLMPSGQKKDDVPYILFLSRLVPEKGAHTLIEAFKKIEFSGLLLIAGGGTHTEKYVESLKNIIKSDPRIRLLGPKYDQEKSDLLQNAVLFVLPSTIEGMPIVLLEAMSFDTPVLVSDIQENMDVIKTVDGDIGYYFKSDDVESLANSLKELLNKPNNMESVARDAKKFATRQYNWDQIASDTLDVYLRVD
jgi:glycosyltransferase involved in cell wall biosynthesis